MTIRDSFLELRPDEDKLASAYRHLSGLSILRQAGVSFDNGDISGGYIGEKLAPNDIGRLLTREYEPPDGPIDPDTGSHAVLTPPHRPPEGEADEVTGSGTAEANHEPYVLAKV